MQVNETKFSRTYLPELGRGRYELVELGGFLSCVYCDSSMKMDILILEDLERQVWFKKHSIVVESIDYICPKNVKSSSTYENSMPDLGKLVPIAGVRNGGVLILKHNNSSIYIYNTSTRGMKKANISMKNLGSCIPYKDSLLSINRFS
ncbi:hypothetical protein FXO38_23142 [Capsicum annuum]|nr:hypothetical protein FXO38_23142 [Capsicum annuum]